MTGLFEQLADALEAQGTICRYETTTAGTLCVTHGLVAADPDGPCPVSYTVNRAELVATLRTIAKRGND